VDFTTSQVQALVYLAMVGVLLGLYKGDRGWGRTLAFWSMIALGGLLVVFAPDLFPSLF
jgi:hypothetical protein